MIGIIIKLFKIYRKLIQSSESIRKLLGLKKKSKSSRLIKIIKGMLKYNEISAGLRFIKIFRKLFKVFKRNRKFLKLIRVI